MIDADPAADACAGQDLSDAEFGELDELLPATPEPLEPLDAVMLDGYLCGVIVQPVLLEPSDLAAHVFDFGGRPLPESVDRAWQRRTTRADRAPACGAESGARRRRLVRSARAGDRRGGRRRRRGAGEVDALRDLPPIVARR